MCISPKTDILTVLLYTQFGIFSLRYQRPHVPFRLFYAGVPIWSNLPIKVKMIRFDWSVPAECRPGVGVVVWLGKRKIKDKNIKKWKMESGKRKIKKRKKGEKREERNNYF